MAHLLKGTNIDVVARLEKIAERSIQKTGFFQSKPDLVLPDDGRVNDPKFVYNKFHKFKVKRFCYFVLLFFHLQFL